MRRIVTMTDPGKPERIMADLQGLLGMVLELPAEGPLLCVSLARIATGSPSAGLVILREATWIPTMQRRRHKFLTGRGERGNQWMLLAPGEMMSRKEREGNR